LINILRRNVGTIFKFVYICPSRWLLIMNAINFRELVCMTSTDDSCRQWLRSHRLLAAEMRCRCGEPMEEKAQDRPTDGIVWRCSSSSSVIVGVGKASIPTS